VLLRRRGHNKNSFQYARRAAVVFPPHGCGKEYMVWNMVLFSLSELFGRSTWLGRRAENWKQL
jgi:hypothetical protein